ncbi:MAG: twitching motility protein PilT [Spirochaetes bacterium GWD1_27_9]|nr:MAG: twitching motility protein PilT [Spirochaetes bacterium GWB1_27_13]OHD22682.1 MAG: twitching motility protein PilT [Spirochaetes bacterium GWC1_27_15]OHD38557.1 MAG: twitching motility protein PilT [Spirochaetes bacterium GWD1_27_9]
MILIDTSIILDLLKNKDNEKIEKFKKILSLNIPFGINKYIYQEILQGAKNEKEFNTLDEYLITQKFYDLKNDINSFKESALLYYKCRKAGLTVKTIDCIIAQTTIENDLYLLHNDKDFENIASVEPKLKFY